jgi:hypothetical protein
MLPNKSNNKRETNTVVNVGFRLPEGIVKALDDIMYTERYRTRTDVFIEILNLGLATRKGLELTKGEVKA